MLLQKYICKSLAAILPLLALLLLAGCGEVPTIMGGGNVGSQQPPTDQGHLVYTLSDQSLRAFHSKTGTLAWPPLTLSEGVPNYQSFLIKQDTIFTVSDQLYAYDANTGKLRWSAPIGISYGVNVSSIIADATNVYLVSNDVVYAFNIQKGSMQWRYETKFATSTGGSIGRSQHEIILQNGILYTIGENGASVTALQANNGQQLWNVQIPDPTDELHVNTLTAADLAFYKGSLYMLTFASIVAINPQDGSQRWIQSWGQVDSWTFAKNTFYVTGTAKDTSTVATTVFAVNADDGTIKWQSQQALDLSLMSRATLEIGHIMGANGTIYIVNGPSQGDITAIRSSDGTKIWATTSATTISSLYAIGNNLFTMQEDGSISFIDGKNGNIAWTQKMNNSTYATIKADNDQVYVADKGRIKALDSQKGGIHWTADAGGNLIAYTAPLILTNDSQ